MERSTIETRAPNVALRATNRAFKKGVARKRCGAGGDGDDDDGDDGDDDDGDDGDVVMTTTLKKR